MKSTFRTVAAAVSAAFVFGMLTFAAGADREQKKIGVDDLQSGKAVIIGEFGSRLGAYFTIEGHRVEGFKFGGKTLQVDAINGSKTDKNILIVIENLDLDRDKQYKLRGYETGEMTGAPPDKENHAASAVQQGYAFRSTFHVAEVDPDPKPAPPQAALAANIRQVSVGELLSGDVQVVGSLGQPLGTFITIEGTKPKVAAMADPNPISVDTIGGKKLATPVELNVREAKEFSPGVRYLLRGYETGGMTSVPIDPAKPDDAIGQQQPYQLAVWFEATQVKQPARTEKAASN